MAVPANSKRTRLFWTLGLTAIAFFMVALDSLVVVTALPAIHREMGADLSTLEWTINAFTLAYAGGIITAAALGDRLGRRRIFTTGLVIFTLGSAACAIAPNVTLLITARAIQGVGAALVMPLSLTILASAFPPDRRGAVVGIWGGIGGLAVASGPLVGGAITQGLDWHWIFWVNVPIGIAAAILGRFQLVESHGPTTKLDLPAAGLVSGGVVAIVWSLIRTGEVGWTNPQVISGLIIGLLLLVAFLNWEARVSDPMLPLHLFRSPAFTAANVTAFLMAGAIFAAAFLMTQYFQFALGYSPFAAGIRLLPWTATPLVVAPLGGMLADRIGPRLILIVGMSLQAAGLGWIATIAAARASYAEFLLPLLLAGIGISLALPVAPTAVLNAVGPRDVGKASGINSTLQRFGSAFAIALAAAVFSANGQLSSAASFTSGFRAALIVVAGLSFAGAVSALATAGRSQRSPTTL